MKKIHLIGDYPLLEQLYCKAQNHLILCTALMQNPPDILAMIALYKPELKDNIIDLLNCWESEFGFRISDIIEDKIQGGDVILLKVGGRPDYYSGVTILGEDVKLNPGDWVFFMRKRQIHSLSRDEQRIFGAIMERLTPKISGNA